MIYSQVEKRCWACGQGNFQLMIGSNYQWQCNCCGHVGHLKVTDVVGQPNESKSNEKS